MNDRILSASILTPITFQMITNDHLVEDGVHFNENGTHNIAENVVDFVTNFIFLV